MTKRQRRIALYFVLAALLLNILVPLARGNQPPGEIYAVLGTIAGYLLVGGKNKEQNEVGDGGGDEPDPPTDGPRSKT